MLNTGIVPYDWCVGIIQPLYKNKGLKNDPDNYRGITLLSCLGKLFTAAINDRLTLYLEGAGVIGEEQAGFIEGYSTVDHIFVLHSLIDFYLFGHQRLYCAFVDFKKAFDLVNRSLLWHKLIANKINGNVLNVIYNMYDNAKSCVRLGPVLSEFFTCNIGVRQGENLSPLLFAIYLNDFEQHVSKYYDGLTSFSRAVKHYLSDEDVEVFLRLFLLLYADDTIVLSETAEELNCALQAVYEYCQDWKLTVNSEKTKVVIFLRGKVQRYPEFKFGGHTLQVVDDYIYLGTTFNYNNRFTKAIAKQKTQAHRAMFALLTKARRLHLPVDILCDLFEKTVVPILLYGCEIWGHANISEIEVFYKKFLKSTLGLAKTTPDCMVYGEVGKMSLQYVIDKRMVNFWLKVIMGKSFKLTNIVYRVLLNMHLNNTFHSPWLLKIKSIYDNCGISYIWLEQKFTGSSGQFKALVDRKVNDLALHKWYTSVSNLKQCSNYRLFKSTLKFETYLAELDFHDRRLLCKFRCGNHKMPVSINRYDSTQNSLICDLCNSHSIGDEYHYLLVCQAISGVRQRYIKHYFYTNPNVSKFNELMNLKPCSTNFNKLIIFVKYLLGMFSYK